MNKTLLALGAHYDDCVFGVPGIMLQAVRKHYRVVILTLIGDYTNWAPAKGRSQEIVQGTIDISREYGVEMRYLDFRSHEFDVVTPAKKVVAAAVADIRPDIALFLWPHDSHDDHRVASQLCDVALKQGDALVPDRGARPPRAMYHYDNGPRHTIGFVPNTFIDVSDDWPQAIEWLGRFRALVRGEAYDPKRVEPSQKTKEAIAAYRGATCGAAYAEALCSLQHHPQDIL